MRQVKLEEYVDSDSLIDAVEETGEGVTVLRAGKPVAQVIPFPVASGIGEKTPESKAAAFKELKAIMEKGYDFDFVWNGRDELYDRD